VKSFGFTECSSNRPAVQTDSAISACSTRPSPSPQATFGGQDLHPTVLEKAAALCASLVQNHPFVDGNTCVGHAAMATFLMLNGIEIAATTDEQERLILDLAAGRRRRDDLLDWLREYTRNLDADSEV